MAKIKLTLPLGEVPVNGKQVTFVAPCDCSVADGIQIDGVDYDIVDSIGRTVSFRKGVWDVGAVLTVTLDVTNHKAYLQNQNSYTKAETLTAATASLFSLGTDAVPDDAFAKIGEAYKYVWERYKYTQSASDVQTADIFTTSKARFYRANSDSNSQTIYYADTCFVDGRTGEISLAGPSSCTFNYNTFVSSAAPSLLGKYAKTVDNDIIYIPSDATASNGYNDGIYHCWFTKYQDVFSMKETSLADSPDPNAYPPAEPDGYTYKSLGQRGLLGTGLGNEYVWAKTKEQFEYYYNVTARTNTSIATAGETVLYADDFIINSANQFVLVNPQTFYWAGASGDPSAANILRGKYQSYPIYEAGANSIHKIASDATFSRASGNVLNATSFEEYNNPRLEVITAKFGYVNSPNPNAYPVDDGYTYTALGQLGEKVRLATGSYTGTGSTNTKKSITFPFKPQMWGVYAKAQVTTGTYFEIMSNMIPWGVSVNTIKWRYTAGTAGDGPTDLSYSENTVSWTPTNANIMLNAASTEYYYFAIA